LEPTNDWIVLYGSLMRGLGAADTLGISGRLRYVGPCVCTGELFDLGDYPGLRLGAARVLGELYALLDPRLLEVLDEFEGFDAERPRESLYLRERVTLIEPAEIEAWIYIYNHAPLASTRIESGDWRDHIKVRR
jgi:pyruvate carboxylase